MFSKVLGKERARMKNTSAYAVLTRFGIIAAVLATLVFIAPVASAAETFTYPENGTAPVATFSATDADGDDIVWGLDGEDKGDFEIDGGVLTFKNSPNFESPADERADNVYKVKVTASGGSIDVEVTVTDVDEDGKPTLTKPQPQVGRGLEAEGPNDPDEPVTDVTWQWARSMDKETWEDIGSPAGSGSRNPTDDDIGYYLRATAMYTDKFGSDKTASVVSENVVEERTVANARPSFASLDTDSGTAGIQVARTVDENAKGALVGKPITATDDDDVLVYSLLAVDTQGNTDPADDTTSASTLFSIGGRSGQITTKIALDSSSSAGAQDAIGDTGADGGDGSNGGEVTHTVQVTVTDPSGASQTQNVTITVNDVNDAPKFPDDAVKTLWVAEGTTDLFEEAARTTALAADTYVATDDDAADGPAASPAAPFTYIVGGADKGSFDISTAGVLTIKAGKEPNYEAKDELSITLMVEDDEFAVGTVDVKVTVQNAEDNGSVELNAREPQVGKAVVASLSDGDGTVRGQEWQWYRNAASTTTDADLVAATTDCEADTATLCPIDGATSPAYTPTADDEGDTKGLLAARVTYTDACVRGTAETPPLCDGLADGETDVANSAFKVTERDVQIADPANTAPKFADDQDLNTAGKQAVAEREVMENAKGANVGDPVVASDADLLMYSISDSTNFSVDNNGQIKTKVALDYEALPEDAKYHMVTLTAEDPSGATDTVMVKITVTDEDDGAVIARGEAEAQIECDDKFVCTYPENGTAPVATFSATDADGDDIVWGLDGEDKGDFEIDGGVLTFKNSPNFESPADERADNVYKVKVTASGGSIDVEVTVTDVDEDGKPTLTKPQPQVGRGLEAEGPNDPDEPVTDVTWQWARSMDKETWEDIGSPAGSGSRNPTDDDIGYYLRATAMYTDKFGSDKTASVVSENVVEERTVANARPSFASLDTDSGTAGIQVARTVDENAKGALVGKPITATDDDDVLVYSLLAVDTQGNTDPADDTTSASTLFSIGGRSGQITTKIALDSSSSAGAQDAIGDTGADGGDGSNGGEVTHTVQVTVTDPSGASQTQNVTITVNDVNDAPKFPDDAVKTLWVAEGTTDLFEEAARTTALAADTYVATDDDAADGPAASPAAPFTYIVGGADKGSFDISTAGVLTIKAGKEPNYEAKDELSITLMVEDDEFAVGTVDVKVTVQNAEDNGSVELNAREPQVGKAVVASLSDGDGTVRGQEWQWYRNAASTTTDADLVAATTDCEADTATLCPIDGATSPAYTPTADDEGDTKGLLAARVTYTDACVRGTAETPPLCDGLADGETDVANSAFKVTERDVQIADPANTAPKFADDQDLNTAGKQAVAEREVMENAKGANVGDPVVASDADLLMYSISDSTNFSVDNNGQIKTKVALDYEALPEDAKYHMVMLTAEDPSGASDSVMVKITVTDENDGAVIALVGGTAPVETTHPCVEGGAVADDATAGLAEDCQTLLDAKDELIGEDGTAELNWSAETPIGEWDGIAMRGTGRVGGIHLVGRGLAGSIPASFNNLVGLERLTLTNNDLTGEIPDLSDLDNLEWLVLGGNAFTGGIPTTLADMDGLIRLWLHRNEGGFEGGIPAELGGLSKLRYLTLHGNGLTGEIPSELGNLTDLKALYLYNNNLSGSIPAELGNIMTDADDTLRLLYLHNNMLTGDVPAELGNLVSLRADTTKGLRLSGNMLTGCIPASIFDAAADAEAAGLMACPADDGS